MTSYDTSANVFLIVEDNGYSVGTSGTITDATFVRFLSQADGQVTAEAPSDMSQTDLNEACALLVCHRIARKLGKTGKVSESLGKGSYSKQLSSGLTSWVDEYDALLYRVRNVPYGIENLSTDGITRDDATMNLLKLDQSTAYSLDDESREET